MVSTENKFGAKNWVKMFMSLELCLNSISTKKRSEVGTIVEILLFI